MRRVGNRFTQRVCAALSLSLLLAASVAKAGGQFTPTGDMGSARAIYGTAPLPDGRVLFTGGIADFGVHLIQSEIYDPASGTFSPGAPMTEMRMRPTTVALADGRVLLLGGRGGADWQALASAEIYDPVSGQFQATGSMMAPRYVASAALLPSGKVLVAGGYNGIDLMNSAELYDPVSGQFTATGNMVVPRMQPDAVARLADGRVLIAGGDGDNGPLASVELYDPAAGTFTLTGNMPEARALHSLVTLANGKVLMVGGSDGGAGGGFPFYYPAAALYDPATGQFSPTGSLSFPRDLQSAARLPDGRVLVAGGARVVGNPGSVTVPTAEIYDPATGTFQVVGDMATPRYEATPVVMANGSVLLAGGWAFAGDTVGDMPTASAELFVPDPVDAIYADGFEGKF